MKDQRKEKKPKNERLEYETIKRNYELKQHWKKFKITIKHGLKITLAVTRIDNTENKGMWRQRQSL